MSLPLLHLRRLAKLPPYSLMTMKASLDDPEQTLQPPQPSPSSVRGWVPSSPPDARARPIRLAFLAKGLKT